MDRKRYGGGIMISIRDDIPSNILKKHNNPHDIESLFIELNLRSQKWLICGLYHPPSQNDEYFFHHLGNAIDSYGKLYDKHLIIGDFNAEDTEPCLSEFLSCYDFSNLVSEKTCFKSKNNPSCIDLFVQNTTVITTGLSDFHKMVITVLKKSFQKAKPKIIQYRDYKKLNENNFVNQLHNSFEDRITSSYQEFYNKFLNVFNSQVPIKRKTIRANHAPFMTKKLSKAIMKITQLQNIYFRKRTIGRLNKYKRQINFCTRLCKKENRDFYRNINLNSLTDNKRFWKTVKPLLSDKGINKSKINIKTETDILTEDIEDY